MNNKRLKYFLILHKTESIRKAAEILHVSPAALSKSIHELEEELDSSLTVASGRGILITEAGKRLARLAEPILEDLENLKREFRNKKDRTKPIRIGSFEVFTTHFLGHLTSILPLSPLFLYEFLPGALENKLLDNSIDYGITYIPIPTAGINHHTTGWIDMQVVGLNHCFKDLPFTELPFVIPLQPLSGIPNKVQGLDGWPEDQQERLIRFRVTSMESALALCRQGKAIAYLPAFVVQLHNKTVKKQYQLSPIAIPLHIRLQKQAVYLVNRKTDPCDAIFQDIKEGLQKFFNGNQFSLS